VAEPDEPNETEVLAPGQRVRDVIEVVDPVDAADNRWIAAAAYLGPAFLFAWLLGRESHFARYHLNQGAIFAIAWIALWIGSVVGSMLLSVIPILGWLIAAGVDLAIVVGWIAMASIGVRNALAGRAEPLPILGRTITIVR
jgi:uncharacterized membrane protein